MVRTGRFSIKHTDYGILFYDEHEKKELSLKEVLTLLNDYVPPKLPEVPSLLTTVDNVPGELPPYKPEPIVMDGNNFSLHSGLGFR